MPPPCAGSSAGGGGCRRWLRGGSWLGLGWGWRAGTGRGPWRYRRERDSSCADFVEDQRGRWHESCVPERAGLVARGLLRSGRATVGKKRKRVLDRGGQAA